MPIYEYQCESCGTTFEKMQRITEPPPEECDACGAGPVHKLISQSTFILKGSGWYVTDYGRGKSRAGKEKAERNESKPAKGESKSEGKSESKPKSEGKSDK